VLGRDAEWAQIEQLLDLAPPGPRGVALEGEPGIGKTTLWREAVSAARAAGYQVLATAPAEPDAALAFAGLGDLFDGLPEDVAASLPGPQRRALDAALFVDDAPDAVVGPQALPRATQSVLRRLGADGPLLVAIDDEQWLDRASARALGFALCRLRDEHTRVLLARRPQSDGALWPELERGFGDSGLPAMVLGSLDMGAIHRLLATNVDPDIPRPLVRRIYDVSSGNPLYALAIARELEASGLGDDREQLPIPTTLAGAIAQRLDRLGPEAGDPLLVAAALSSPTLSLIQAVLPQFVFGDLDGAERARLIEVRGERLTFTHPLIASTQYSRAPAERRRELHRILAEVVHDDERAHHLALGAEAPDREIAFALEEAAGQAARRGAPEHAAQLLEHAARLTPADAIDARRSRIVAAAERNWTAGDGGRARALLEPLLADLTDGALRARALKLLGRIRSDDFELATELYEQALAQAGDHPRVAAEIEDALAEVYANRGDQEAAVRHVERAVELAELAGDRELLAATLAGKAMTAFFHGDGVQRDVLNRAIEIEEEEGDLIPSEYPPSGNLGCALFWSDQLESGRPQLHRALSYAAKHGQEVMRGALLFHLAHLEWLDGDIEEAQRCTADAVEAARAAGDDQFDSYILWLKAFSAVSRGDLEEARARGNEAIDLAGRIGDNFIVCFSTSIVAMVELWTGQPESAHERVAPLRDGLVGGSQGFVGSLTLPFWWIDIEALIALGRLDEVDPILKHLFTRARGAQNPNAVAIGHRCRGLLLAADGELDDAIDELERAVTEHERRPVPLDLGRTLLEKGTLERRAKRKSVAKQSLERALSVLEPLQAALWVNRARDELSRVGLRRAAASDGLTPAQTRVAELVVAGMTNREIANTLYMSLRTVETHLTKVYRELGVRSRAQLIASMSAAGDEAIGGGPRPSPGPPE